MGRCPASHPPARGTAPAGTVDGAADAPPDQHGATLPGLTDQDALARLGWSDRFAEQIAPDEAALRPMRLSTVHRARLTALAPGRAEASRMTLPVHAKTTDFAVGDWVLADPETLLVHRRLDRRTLLDRRTPGSAVPQLIAANVDTLFVVTSCNADFNVGRLERYLALANEAGTRPVLLLTKADTVPDPERYRAAGAALQRDLPVLTLNAKADDAAALLAGWCGPGQTVALIGSSGVGKSTLLNTLAGPDQPAPQQTGDIRASDARGRHTTTSRSLHAIAGGGWVIDTPGMRSLAVADVAGGLEVLFAEITELAPLCRFRDCTHAHEPGCAVQAAVAAGTLDEARLQRWRKLGAENRDNTPPPTRRAGPGAKGRRLRG